MNEHEFTPGDLVVLKDKFRAIDLINDDGDRGITITSKEPVLIVQKIIKSKYQRYDLRLYVNGKNYYGIKEWFDVIP